MSNTQYVHQYLLNTELPNVFRDELTIPVWTFLSYIDILHDEIVSNFVYSEEIQPVVDRLVNQIYFEYQDEKAYVQSGYNVDLFNLIDSNQNKVMEYSDPNTLMENVLIESASINVDDLINYIIYSNKKFFEKINKIIIRNYDNGEEYIFVINHWFLMLDLVL